jgi:hypothetical protein
MGCVDPVGWDITLLSGCRFQCGEKGGMRVLNGHQQAAARHKINPATSKGACTGGTGSLA